MKILDKQHFRVYPVELKKKKFKQKQFLFEGIASGNFDNCVFEDCEFRNISGFFLGFQGCIFKNCFIDNVNFSHAVMNWQNNLFEKCNIRRVNFDEGDMSDVTFKDTWFRDLTMGGMFPMKDVHFIGCTLEGAVFGAVCYDSIKEFRKNDLCLLFEKCSLDFVYFNRSELRNVKFKDCRIVFSYLLDCSLSKDTFKTTKGFEMKNGEYLVMNADLATLKKSLDLGKDYLKKFLGVNDSRLLDIARDFLAPPAFHSVFISYSFKDSKAARIIYEFLKSKKSSCFLWQEDAPGGQYLEHVMASEIKKRSKVVFIASQNSLKSAACQFELSEGRSKQTATWDEVFVPVYVDRYLFDVNEYQVRPKEKAAEYWRNILELRSINCIDATAINSANKRSRILSDILDSITIRSDVKK